MFVVGFFMLLSAVLMIILSRRGRTGGTAIDGHEVIVGTAPMGH
jgi:hypothetical protein